MTEYDYSPDAYERHIANQSRVLNWVSNANQHAREFVDPFVEPPHRPKNSFYNNSQDSSEDVRRPHILPRSFTAPIHHPSLNHRSSSRSRRPTRPPSPSTSSSSSSSTSSVAHRNPIDPYKYSDPVSSHKYPEHHTSRKPQDIPPQPIRPHQPRSQTTYTQGNTIHAPSPIRVPYRTAQGADLLLAPGQNYVIVEGQRVDHFSPSSRQAPRRSSSQARSPPVPLYAQPVIPQQAPMFPQSIKPQHAPVYTNPYPSPPLPLLSPTYQYPSQPGYYSHPPPHPHHHPPPHPQRPLLKRVMGTFSKHSDTSRRSSRRDY